MVKSVCVFCGSSFGNRPEYREAAKELGTLIARRGLRLVYGGAKVGLMGAVSDACMSSAGTVVGVMPRLLVEKEIAHQGLSELRVVESMHERKALMAELADAFIALPGGFGTFEEFFEIATWAQLGLQRKAYGLLNVAGYYDSLIAQADHSLAEGFLKPQHRAMLLSHKDVSGLLDLVCTYQPAALGKWS